jgi:two-component sensor histidine kinase
VENAVTSLAEAPDGTLIAGTWGGGLLRYNPGRDRFEIIPSQLEETGHGIILDIAFSGNTVYLATGAGLLTGSFPQSLTALHKSNWTSYQPDKGNERSLSGKVVFGLLLDKLNNLWLATSNNISRADLRMSHFQHQKAIVASNTELLPNVLLPAGPSLSPGSFWLGSNGLYLANTAQKNMEKIPLDGYIHNSEGQKSIWDMSPGKTGIWLATTGGLLQFDPGTKKVTRSYYHEPGKKNTLAGERLWKVHEDKSGKVWVATIRQGISILHPSTASIHSFFGAPNEKATLFNKTTTDFWEDSKGNTWFGSDNMLYCYHSTADTFQTIPFMVPQKGSSPLTGKPNPFYEDGNGNIWLSTNDGIISFNPEKKVFKPILTGVQFFNPAGEITMDSGGNFWFGTTNGLFRWDTANNQLTRFTNKDGLLSNEMDGCITRLENGLILSGSLGAITFFFPQLLLGKEPAPPVAISLVQVNGRDTSVQFDTPPLLPHQSTLSFSYAALSYGNASQNYYSYMLKGTDKDWNPATQNTTVTYAKLPAGKYTFMVKGSNSDGVWNPVPVIFSFRIEAPFYLKWWFILMAVFLLAISLVSFYRYRLMQALKVERLRTRLATDLHDDVGATLSAISMYSDALKKQVEKPQLVNLLEKMGEDSREMVRTMSDLVWAINPKNDGGDKLIQRMENYATDLCASKDVTLHFESDPNLPAHTFGIETRRNIFLIFKEALTNALKYAGGSQLQVKIGTEGNHFFLCIADNGKGFDAATISYGNGLKNMQTRAAEINGKLAIETSPENGCTIILRCTL